MLGRVPSGMCKENNWRNVTHMWFWKSRLPERKGQLCKIIARGKMNSILVEFEDGFRVVTSRYAVRRKIIK